MPFPKLEWNLYANPIYNSTSPLERNLSRMGPTEATFSTSADGGFAGGTLAFENVSAGVLDLAFNDWIMKRVTATDSAGVVAYEGFVGEIEVSYGYHTYTRSMDPFFNRAWVVYSTSGSTCPGGGTCEKRLTVNETDIDSTYASQGVIGIKEEWIDYGPDLTTSTLATRKGKQEMSKVLKPMFANLQLGRGASPAGNALTLTLYSAWATLGWRKTTAKAQVATAIHTLLGTGLTSGTPAQYIVTSDLTRLDSTGQSITYNVDSTPLWLQDWILGALTGGDSAGRRLFFQIAAGRIPVLYSRKTAPAYFSRHGEWRVLNADRGVIPPYLVQAGGYIQADDLTANLDEPTDVIGRTRVSLIEETNYDAINDVLDIPPPSSLLDTRRLAARQYRRGRQKQYSPPSK